MPNGIRIDQARPQGTVGLGEQAPGIQQEGGAPGIQPARVREVRGRAGQVIPQQPLGNIHVSRTPRSYQEAVEAWQRTRRPQDLAPRTLGVVMPGSQHTVQIDGRMMEAELRSIPRDQREQMLQNLPRILQNRINRGFRIYNGVQDGTIRGPARPDDIRDLMTFLMAKAMERGDGFSEGAFNIEDPGQRLKNFLDSCPEGYNRPSSHIDDFQAVRGGEHRGIDLDLPYGKHTLLYGAMKKGVLGLEEDRLFLKMETHGCRLAQLVRREREGAPRNRPFHFRDIGDFLGHAAGYLKTLLRTISGGKLFSNSRSSRKERIPSDISRDFKNILRHLDRTGQKECAALLRENKPLAKAQGIRTLFVNVSRALNARNLNLDQETRTMLMALFDKVVARYDHLNARIGNEIVLDRNELVPPSHLTQIELRQRTAVQNATAILKTAVASLLDVPDPEHLTRSHVEQFTRALTKIAINFDRAGGGPDVLPMIEQAVHDSMQILSPDQREHLRVLLANPRLRGIMASIHEVATGQTMLPVDTDESMEKGMAVAQRAVPTYLLLCKEIGFEQRFDNFQPEEKYQEMATSLLVSAGSDLVIGEKAWNEEPMIEFISIDDIRKGLGPDAHAIGSEAEALFHGDRVNREGIHREITDKLIEDFWRYPDNGPEGLYQEFVKDFFRSGITVNGRHFGGPQQLRNFIDAVGGLKKAQQIARIAHQGAFGILMVDGLQQDPGFRDVLLAFATFNGEDIYRRLVFSLDVREDNVTIRCEYRGQKISKGLEMGQNLFLQVSLQGVGTDDVHLTLDRWDAVYSSRTA